MDIYKIKLNLVNIVIMTDSFKYFNDLKTCCRQYHMNASVIFVNRFFSSYKYKRIEY